MGQFRRFLPLPRVLLVVALSVTTLATHLGARSIPLPREAQPISLWAVATGLAIIAWALLTLGEGMLGGVQPTAQHLVTRGPYRWVRHPVYVGMLIAMVGYGVAVGSWVGLVATAIIVVPAIGFRALREEAALARAFPDDWPPYRARTGAFLPGLTLRRGLRRSV
jgi:protein-S-isoprenylcysteine O-methyltransferase Ste14